jgi:hypothetical protein
MHHIYQQSISTMDNTPRTDADATGNVPSIDDVEVAEVVVAVRPPVRTGWFHIEKKVQRNGLSTTTYPFLSRDNTKDLVFARHLHLEKPYMAAHGQMGKVWELVVEQVGNEKDFRTGELIFPEGVSAKTLKDRFIKFKRSPVS